MLLMKEESPAAERLTGSLLLCAATRWEAEPIAAALGLKPASKGLFAGSLAGRSISLVQVGIGPRSAALVLSRLPAQSDLSLVVSVGLCGALQQAMKTGDIVCDFAGTDAAWPPLARETAGALQLDFHFGRMAHSEEVLQPDTKIELGRKLRAAAVDMETDSVRRWAAEKNISACAIRSVLDAVDEKLPGFYPKNETPAALAQFALRHWADAPILMRTYFKQKKAMLNLKRFLADFLAQI
jgi:nucleoside phosphorylase